MFTRASHCSGELRSKEGGLRSVTIAARCLDTYPWMKFAYCLVHGLAPCGPSPFLAGERATTERYVRDNIAMLSQRAKAISKFYRSQGEKNRSHIESLLKAIANGKTIKPVNSIVDAVMISEMRHALLLGVHDLERVVGDITVDVARDGETFTGIGDRNVVTRANEVVLRDDQGIWASYTQGPDSRTVIGPATTDAVVIGFFTPESILEEMTDGIGDAVGILTLAAGGSADEIIVLPR
jgi:DNA/RNA-binding domain of Phe-tRNA-synthetase-like protein